MGRALYKEIDVLKGQYKIIILDNGQKGNEVDGIEIIDQEKCINQYHNALYVITIQNQFVTIISNLLFDGIKPEQIVIYDEFGIK